MKMKNVTLSLAWGVAVALWLFAMTVLAAECTTEKCVTMNPTNAVQHIVNVKLISEDWSVADASVLKLAGKNLVWVQTNNFIISKDEASLKLDENERVNKIDGSLSNILWGVSNEIQGTASTILWWKSNINKGNHSTILWWESNIISEGNYSTIVWWSNNVLKGDNSVIVGWGVWNNNRNEIDWNNSVVLWNGSSVKWNHSVALWSNSKIDGADNSFLWTDGSQEALNVSNVFVVKSAHWMVVNADSAHPLAQLTIGWPLVIHQWSQNLECTDSWVVKVVDWEDIGDGSGRKYKCFCGCDWLVGADWKKYWHSLYGQWRCERMCNTFDRAPGCGDSVTKRQENGKWVFEWTCNKFSKPVVWLWAYVVDKRGKVHWTCQNDAGNTAACEGFATAE